MLFTTGSKLFYGVATIGLIAWAVFAFTEGFSPWGTVLLGSLTGVAAAVGSIVLAYRDNERVAVPTIAGSPADAEGVSASGPLVSPSAWPVIGAFGAACVVIGLVVDRRLFMLGVIVLTVTLIEWMVTAWADRRSADRGFNLTIRGRTLHPLEFPILGVLISAFIVLGLSRVLLAATKEGSIIVFSGIAIVVFLVAIVIAARPAISRTVLFAILGLAGVGVLAAGVGGAISGERGFEEHEGGTEGVSNPTSLLASVTLRDGAFELDGPGVPTDGGEDGPLVYAPRSTIVSMRFSLLDEGHARLVIREDGEEVAASNEIAEDGETVITFRLVRSGEYELAAERDEGAGEVVGRIVVP
jgi:hypothetical protein